MKVPVRGRGEQGRPAVPIPGGPACPGQMAATLQTSLGAHSLTKRPESSPQGAPNVNLACGREPWHMSVLRVGDEEVMSGAGRAQGGAGLRVRGDRAGAPSSSPPTGATSAHHRGGCDPQTLVQQGGATPGHRRVPWPPPVCLQPPGRAAAGGARGRRGWR